MAGSTIGEIFSVRTYGTSHTSDGVGAVIDGCPAGIELDQEAIQHDLNRRRPGQSKLTTQRKELDVVQIQSGVFEGVTMGDPINLFIPNMDARSGAYDHMKDLFRPGHADVTYDDKYGVRDHTGGARASARTTAAVVAAGAVAKLVVPDVRFTAYVKSVRDVEATIPDEVTQAMVESNIVRCPDLVAAAEMEDLINNVRKSGDSVGGIVELRISGQEPGLGEPVFDRFDADLARAMMAIPASKGVEFGLGFAAVSLFGSEHNDEIYMDGEQKRTRTNNAGGILGGITNGEDVVLRVAFKPTATISHLQTTITKSGETVEFSGTGRHDPCVLPRAVPIVEAMAAIVTADHTLRQRSAHI